MNSLTKRICAGCAALLMVASVGMTAVQSTVFAENGSAVEQSEAASVEVTIADENLRKAICKALGKDYSEGIAITKAEMESLKELNCSNSGIKDITGIESAVNLEILDLSGNPIGEDVRYEPRKFGDSFNALGSLTSMKKINLSNCRIGDNYCGYTNAKLKIPACPDELIQALECMKDIEEIDLSDNDIAGNIGFYIGLNGYEKLKKLDLSGNRLDTVSGLASRFLNTLEEIDLSDNYFFWDERDGNWHQALMNSTTVKTNHDDQKNLASLYAIYYTSNGETGTSYDNFTAAVIDEKTKTVDLGTLCGGSVTIAPACYANANTVKVTINGTKVTGASVYDLSSLSDSSVQYQLTNVADGEHEYKLEVMHMGEDTQTYTLKFNMTSVPKDDENVDSAGITDINLQAAVCKALKIPNEVSTHVVTKAEMASLKTLNVNGVKNAEGIQYATNLTSLGISGDYEELPDISRLTKLKTLTMNAPNLKKSPDLSPFTALTNLSVSADANGDLPDISNQKNITRINIYYSDKDVIPAGLENCTKLTSYTLSKCGGEHSFPTNIVTPKGTLTYAITSPIPDSTFSLAGVENTNVTNLKFSYNSYDEAKNVKITGVDEKTTPLTSFGAGAGATNSLYPEGLGKAPNLTSLTVNGPVDKLPDSLAQADKLTTFVINNALSIPKVVENFTNLTTFSSQGVSSVPEDFDFSKMTNLKKLTIIDSGMTKVPSADKLPPNIEKLELRNGKIISMDTTGYDKLENLKELDLSYNQFTSFPEAVSEIPNLQNINLMLNFIGSVPKNAFDNMKNLQTLMIGSLMPLQNADNGEQVVDDRYPDTKAAIEKAKEITAANGGMVMAETYQAQFYGNSYAMLASLDSDKGVISSSFGTNTEAFKVLGNGVTSVTLKPTAILPDTVITYNGKDYKSGEEIKIDGLVDGTNEITLTAHNDFKNFANVPTTVTYKIKLFCGQTITADDLEEGHTYRIDYKLYKSGLTVESMSAGYFDSYAVVRFKNGKYEVKLKTNKASYISDMDYYQGDTRLDADLVENNVAEDTATYRVIADNLKDRLVISPYVVPMGYYPKCDVVFDTTNIVDISDQVPSVDLSDLNIAINEALAITEKNNIYTDESYSDFLKALEAAQTVAGDKLSTQEEADKALEALKNAMNGLKVDENKLADKAALKAQIDEAKAITKGTHTDSAWNALQEAIADAEEVYNTTEARQSEVDKAAKALKTAVTLFNNSGEASKLDKNDLADGVYSIYVDMIKMDRENKSMSDNAINHIVKLEVKNGEYFITLDFKGITIENRFGYLKNLSYYADVYTYGQYGTVTGDLVPAEVLSTQKDSDGNDVIDQYNDKNSLYPDLVKIKLVPTAISDEEGYVPLHVFVPIMEAIAEGNGDQDVLMKIDWTSLKKTTADDPGFQPEDPIEQSPAVDYTDTATGVKIHADKGVFEEGVKVIISEITSGKSYDNAKKVLSEVSKFKAYDVGFENADGSVAAPNGTVEISLPIPSGYDTSKIKVYRINDNGSKTVVNGVIADGFYTIKTKSAGVYAIAEIGETTTSSGSSNSNADTAKSTNAAGSANPSTGAAAKTGLLAAIGAAFAVVSKKRKDK